MSIAIFDIPFFQYGKKCSLKIEYGVNTDPITSGFEIVKSLVPDISICIGYPTMHAYIDNHGGFGFTKYSGFIQTVEINSSNQTIHMVDVPPALQEMKIPFIAYGYPAEIYDAPVNNYGLGSEMHWVANTFLVDMPSFVNGNEIVFLAGFRWGYKEYDMNDEKHISCLPFEMLNQDDWKKEIPFLCENYGEWNYT